MSLDALIFFIGLGVVFVCGICFCIYCVYCGGGPQLYVEQPNQV